MGSKSSIGCATLEEPTGNLVSNHVAEPASSMVALCSLGTPTAASGYAMKPPRPTVQ